ncbi:hypothetical protein ADL27_40775 [Streptomyces sp. NRRL F-6602]|nr:hypothetical protein ADL27_40775 [Streptomyces sp. NRRL F-6602]
MVSQAGTLGGGGSSRTTYQGSLRGPRVSPALVQASSRSNGDPEPYELDELDDEESAFGLRFFLFLQPLNHPAPAPVSSFSFFALPFRPDLGFLALPFLRRFDLDSGSGSGSGSDGASAAVSAAASASAWACAAASFSRPSRPWSSSPWR